MKQIDLSNMPSGKRYEDTYGAYLEIFRDIAETPPHVEILVVRPPASWVPLLMYLGCKVYGGTQNVFEHDDMVACILNVDWIVEQPFDRTAVEVLCGFRPELVDALWKCDMEWRTKRVPDEAKREFIVTTNGAFHRKEVLVFMRALDSYVPRARKAVLVPCAADKPYPSPLHEAVLARMPADFELINATGVLGLVPQAMWPVMPYYDSGIPNEWRLYNTVRRFFRQHDYVRVIAYTDFYSYAIVQGMTSIGMPCDFVDPPTPRNGYLDLLDPDRLRKLEVLFNAQQDAVVCHAKKGSCICGVKWNEATEAKPDCRHYGGVGVV